VKTLWAGKLAHLFFYKSILFSKQKMNHWKLTLLLGCLVFISAMAGGYWGQYFDEKMLKFIFAIVMFVASVIMLIDLFSSNS